MNRSLSIPSKYDPPPPPLLFGAEVDKPAAAEEAALIAEEAEAVELGSVNCRIAEAL